MIFFSRHERGRKRVGFIDYFYDDRGNLTREINPLGHETPAQYDDWGNPVRRTDPLGNTSSMTYDQRNNLLSHTNPLGRTIA
jgi:YD repeat-containing protein